MFGRIAAVVPGVICKTESLILHCGHILSVILAEFIIKPLLAKLCNRATNCLCISSKETCFPSWYDVLFVYSNMAEKN